MQLTNLFVDARNNLILLLFAKAETKGRIHRADIKKLIVLVVLIFFMNTLCMNSILFF